MQVTKSAIGKALNTPLSPMFLDREQLKSFITGAKQARHDATNPSAGIALRIAARAAYGMYQKRIKTELIAGARHRYPYDNTQWRMHEGQLTLRIALR